MREGALQTPRSEDKEGEVVPPALEQNSPAACSADDSDISCSPRGGFVLKEAVTR